MELFKLWAVLGFLFLFLEIAAPSMFFLPLGGAAFFAAIAAFKYPDEYWAQAGVFALFAFLFFVVVRPLIRKRGDKRSETGVEAKYINNEALVVKDIIATSGTIKIYDETWQAKSIDGTEIKAGERVKIVRNESLVMFVEKIS